MGDDKIGLSYRALLTGVMRNPLDAVVDREGVRELLEASE
jgi:hypothetical protein